MLEAARTLNNKNKLQELYPDFRVRIEAILKELERAGYRPHIQSAWRSQADQMDAYRRGASKVQFGFHNITGLGGVKEALAVDILDDDRPATINVDFALHLADAADAIGLTTGIRWNLSDDASVLVDIALRNKHWEAKIHVGWDPYHVEPLGITIAEAKSGNRPDFTQTSPPVEPGPRVESSQPKKHFRVQDVDTNESIDYNNWSTAFKPVTLLPVPYVSQLGAGAETHKNDCGAASAIMLLRAYTNTSMTPDEFYVKFNIAGDPYLSVPALRDAMSKLDVLTNFKSGLTMADLFNMLATGKPVIVLIRYKILEDAGLTEKHFEGPHFAVAVGMDTKYIYLHDPLYTNVAVGDAHPYPLDIFWKAWTEAGLDPKFANPQRAAIIPAVGLGYHMEKAVMANLPLLNIRIGPGLGHAAVGVLKKGQIVKVIREVNGWGAIDANQWIYLPYTLPTS